jgi:hypothetical protein
MRTRTAIVVVSGCVIGFVLGYLAGSKQPPHGRLTLATVLRQRGLGPETITHFRFIGDEHSHTTGRVAVDTNVAWIWDRMIATAEPYSFWEASGNRRVEVFRRGADQAAVVLLVNATDATAVAGDERRFMCHGLHELAVDLLSQPQTSEKP